MDLCKPVGYTVRKLYQLTPNKVSYRYMANQKYNILYGRLSQEDERQRNDRQRNDRQKEANSILNQKFFLEQYAADHGFENTLFLVDDGYFGSNFYRRSGRRS